MWVVSIFSLNSQEESKEVYFLKCWTISIITIINYLFELLTNVLLTTGCNKVILDIPRLVNANVFWSSRPQFVTQAFLYKYDWRATDDIVKLCLQVK